MDDRVAGSALPTLRQLQFLAALKAHGSFVRAAEDVGVAQPTLSAGIKELEAALGVVLVDRSRQGAVLTPAGEEAAARASRAIEEVQDIVRSLKGATGALAGPFRLGAIPTIAPFLLPRAMPALKAQFPHLRLVLKEDLTARLVECLRARTLDAALIALPYEASGIETAVLGEDEFLLAAPEGHALLTKAGLTPADLGGEELLLLDDGHCLREHALAVCRLPPGRRAADVGATSLYTLMHMVGGGMGVTLAPRLAVDAGVAAGAHVEMRAFAEPVIGRSIGLVWRQGSARAGDVQLLAQVLAQIMSPTSLADSAGQPAAAGG